MITKQKLTLCIIAVILTVLVSEAFLPGNEGDIYTTATRLHILANSDSDYDQAVKYRVRDEIIAHADTLKSLSDTETLKARITEIACTVSSGQTVTARYGREYYETREYDGVLFPAGTYNSLQIILGDGKGKNWWCVLFPPLCLSSATVSDALTGAGMDRDSVNVFVKTDNIKYKFRFRILEFFGFFGRE